MTGRQSAKDPTYPGKLNEPLDPHVNLPPIESEEYPEEAPPAEPGGDSEFEWRLEYDEKCGLLCDHFSIARDDPDRWMKLALALAKRHVPGFQEKHPETRGRRREWEIGEEFALWYEFDVLVKSGKKERPAAEILLKHHPDIKASPAALVIRLKRFNKSLKVQLEDWWIHKRR
ncbi:MAG: hypothetical protein ACRED7_08880 [Stellaceae bacterium]